MLDWGLLLDGHVYRVQLKLFEIVFSFLFDCCHLLLPISVFATFNHVQIDCSFICRDESISLPNHFLS